MNYRSLGRSAFLFGILGIISLLPSLAPEEKNVRGLHEFNPKPSQAASTPSTPDHLAKLNHRAHWKVLLP